MFVLYLTGRVYRKVFHTGILDIDGSQTYASCVTGKVLDALIPWKSRERKKLDGLCVEFTKGASQHLEAVSCSDSLSNLICQVFIFT